MAFNILADFEIRHTKEVHDQLLADAQARSRQVREGAELSLQLQWNKEETDRTRERADALDRQTQLDLEKAEQEQRVRQIEINANAEQQRQHNVHAEAVRAEQERRRLHDESVSKAQQELQRQLNVQAEEARRKQEAQNAIAQSATISAESSLKLDSIPKSTASITPSTTPITKGQPAALTPLPATVDPIVKVPEIGLAQDIARFSQYSSIHKNLKRIRKLVKRFATIEKPQFKEFYKKAGEVRRQIQTAVSQLKSDGTNSTIAYNKIMTALKAAYELHSYTEENKDLFAPGSDFAAEPRDISSDGNSGRLPILYLYALNAVSRSVCKQWVMEAADNPEKAQAVAILALRVFSARETKWCGKSFIDILVAKIYVTCPVLLGARGDTTTGENGKMLLDASDIGKKRLGWRQAKDAEGRKMVKQEGDAQRRIFVDENTHYSRVKGIAAGFAALTLRYFRAGNHPCPSFNYWFALEKVVNCPPTQVTATHCMVLQGLVQSQFEQFIKFYGNFGVEALQLALIRFAREWTESRESDKAIKGSLMALEATFNQYMAVELMQVEPMDLEYYVTSRTSVIGSTQAMQRDMEMMQASTGP